MEQAGSVRCQENILCRCDLRRSGTITGETAGYGWDCGILRPSCEKPGPDYEPQDPLPSQSITVAPIFQPKRERPRSRH